MENLIKVLLLLLLPFASQGQSLRWFATVQPRDTDTAITLNQLKMPWYSTEDSNKVLGVDENGLVVLRTKGTGGGGSETLQQVISNGNVLTKDDTIVVDGNSFWWEEVDQMYILNGGVEAFRFDAFEGYLYIYGDTVATRPYVRSLIPLQGIANQDDTTQIADFKINGTGQVGDLIVESTIPPTVRLKNTNTTTGDGPFMTMEVTGQNPSSIQYVPKDQTNTLPWLRGARGTGLNMQSPGNLYYVTLGLEGAENADHVFYVNQGAPAYDSLVRFDHNGDVYVYHKPTLGTGDTVLKRRWDGKLQETVVTGGGTPTWDEALQNDPSALRVFNSGTTDSTDNFDGELWQMYPTNYLSDYGAGGVGMNFGWYQNRFDGVNGGGNRPNYVWSYGYNTNGSGRINTDEASFRFGMESSYYMLGGQYFEFHLPEIIRASDGLGLRPWSLYSEKNTGATFIQSTANSVTFFNDPGTQSSHWLFLGQDASTADMSLQAHSTAGTEDGVATYEITVREHVDDGDALLSRLTTTLNKDYVDLSTDKYIKLSTTTIRAGEMFIEPANNSITINSTYPRGSTEGLNLFTAGKSLMIGNNTLVGQDAYTRNYAGYGVNGEISDGGILMGYTITDDNVNANSLFGFLHIVPEITHASGLIAQSLVKFAPEYTSTEAVNAFDMKMLDISPQFHEQYGFLVMTGISFNPLIGDAPGDVTNPFITAFENVIGDNYFNISGGATGFGYATHTGAADHLVNINGTLKMESAITIKEISAPSTPASGYGKVYVKSGKLYYMDSAGVEYDLTD